MGLNNQLDRFVRPEVTLLGAERSAFQVCGLLGLCLCMVGAAALASWLGLSLWALGGLTLASLTASLLVAVADKAVRGSARLVFYHHALSVLLVVAGGAWLLDEPVLLFLDVTAVGLGLFLACARIGCLMVGCCHGLPHRIGVCYREEHAAAGFEGCLVGVRLLPVQLMEAMLALAATVVAAAGTWIGRGQPGDALAVFLVAYALGRFVLEFGRGDAARPIVVGFSEAQWVSLAIAGAVGGAELLGVLPPHRWHFAAALLMPFLVVFVVSWRYLGRTPRYRLLHPQHVREVASALELLGNLDRRAASQGGKVFIGCTSLGVQLSVARVANGGATVDLVAISQKDTTMSEETARVMIDLVALLRQSRCERTEIVPGRLQGVYHLLLHHAPAPV